MTIALARTVLATLGVYTIVNAQITFQLDVPNAEINATASRIPGIAIKPSQILIKI